ncbi:ComF family protein [Halalkalibacillus sediminis]|nr:phosphoribosyltransferase family protein [Halalkalibacillus sediminis]
MKEQIAIYKYRGDYEIVFSWQEELRRVYLKHYKKDKFTLIPIPLSEERQFERGFNQAEGIARCIGTNINQSLVRTQHTEKQSKRKKRQRMEATNPFLINGEVPKRALIIDDIYTTGTTIRQAAQCLREAGAEEVESLTLIRS